MENREITNTLSDIRNLMERSTRFLSLSGLSVILVGLYACIGAYIAYSLFNGHSEEQLSPPFLFINTPRRLTAIFILAAILLLFSSATVLGMSYIKAKKAYQRIAFDKTTRRLLWNFSLPLATGGLLCFSLLTQQHYGLTSSIMLIFYGLALVNCSKYTHSNIQYLGYAEILLGIIDSFIQGYALLFWVVGFGLFHILYGTFFSLNEKKRNDLVSGPQH